MRVRLAPCKIIQECLGFWIPPHGFRIPGTELQILCQCYLESDFIRRWNYGFLKAVFRIPEPRIPSLALGSTVEERRTKKIGKGSEPSGSLAEGKGWRSL